MDLRKFEVFSLAVQLGNLSKVGDALGYTQSGVSHMMKNLENELGFKLLVRSRSGIRPTPEGELLLPIIQKMLNCNEQFEQTAASINGLNVGRLRIGAYASVAWHWMPTIINTFREAYPDVKVMLYEGDADEMEENLEKGFIDCAFISKQPHHTADWVPLRKESLVAIIPSNHPLKDTDEFPISAFRDESFILTAKGLDYDVNRIFSTYNITPKVMFNTINDLTTISLVKCGAGTSIVTKLSIKDHLNTICWKKLNPPQFRELGILLPSLSEASPAMKKFIDCTKQLVDNNIV